MNIIEKNQLSQVNGGIVGAIVGGIVYFPIKWFAAKISYKITKELGAPIRFDINSVEQAIAAGKYVADRRKAGDYIESINALGF